MYSFSVPPKFCISIVFNFSWDLREIENNGYGKFWRDKIEYYGKFENGLYSSARAWTNVREKGRLLAVYEATILEVNLRGSQMPWGRHARHSGIITWVDALLLPLLRTSSASHLKVRLHRRFLLVENSGHASAAVILVVTQRLGRSAE